MPFPQFHFVSLLSISIAGNAWPCALPRLTASLAAQDVRRRRAGAGAGRRPPLFVAAQPSGSSERRGCRFGGSFTNGERRARPSSSSVVGRSNALTHRASPACSQMLNAARAVSALLPLLLLGFSVTPAHAVAVAIAAASLSIVSTGGGDLVLAASAFAKSEPHHAPRNGPGRCLRLTTLCRLLASSPLLYSRRPATVAARRARVQRRSV